MRRSIPASICAVTNSCRVRARFVISVLDRPERSCEALRPAAAFGTRATVMRSAGAATRLSGAVVTHPEYIDYAAERCKARLVPAVVAIAMSRRSAHGPGLASHPGSSAARRAASGAHSAEQYQRQPCQIPASPVLPGARPMNDAPQARQVRSMLVSGFGWPCADFWRTGYLAGPVTVWVTAPPGRPVPRRPVRALSGCP